MQKHSNTTPPVDVDSIQPTNKQNEIYLVISVSCPLSVYNTLYGLLKLSVGTTELYHSTKSGNMLPLFRAVVNVLLNSPIMAAICCGLLLQADCS